MAHTPTTPTDRLEQRLEEIARLLAVLVARDRTLQDTIADLSTAGFGPTRIGELIGTSTGYAKVAATRAKTKKATPKGSKKNMNETGT